MHHLNLWDSTVNSINSHTRNFIQPNLENKKHQLTGRMQSRLVKEVWRLKKLVSLLEKRLPKQNKLVSVDDRTAGAWNKRHTVILQWCTNLG